MPTDTSAGGSRSIETRSELLLTTFFGLALLALGWAGLAAYRSTQNLLATADSAAKTHARTRQLTAVLDAVIDAETGSRGYLITGDPEFLDPYHRGNAVVARELAALETLYAGSPLRRDLLATLHERVAARFVHVDSTIALRRAGDYPAARELVASRRGKVLTDSIRAIIGALVTDELAAQREGEIRIQGATRSTNWTVSGLGVLALLLLGTAFAALRRESRRRRQATLEVRALNETLAREVDRIRDELLGSEQRLRNALDGLLEGCALIDFDCRYLYVNRASAAQGRSSVDQMVGRTMMEVYPGFETTELHSALQRTLVERITHRATLPFTFPDGSTGWFELHFDPVAEGAFVLSVEVTEQVQAQRALERSEARHRALLRGLPDLVLLLDAHGLVVDFHAPPGSTLPGPAAVQRGQPFAGLLPPGPAEEFQMVLNQALAVRQPRILNWQAPGEAERRTFEATVVPGEDDRVTVVIRDTTVRQNLEAQLRQAQKMEAVGNLTGGIAHDFNNILTIIGSNAELLQLSGRPEEAREVGEILHATHRGAAMIARLLQFSRRGMLDRRPVNLAGMIPDILPMLRRLVPPKVAITADPPAGDQVTLVDTGALEQVLANLCTNARDAMPGGGGIHIGCTPTELDGGYHATHPWVRPGQYLCLSVRDTGTGMDGPTMERIFEPFFTTKPAGVGTGLGMAMVYGIMKEHNGMVHVYSEPGQGTAVKLYFPLAAGATPSDTRPAMMDSRQVSGGGESLLLVEDDQAIRLATRRALEGKGYRVFDAPDGEQALDLFRRHRDVIALVISDLVMPNLGGAQLAEALRADGADVPILFISGFSQDSLYRESALPPGVAFLHKPWTLSTLFTTVRAQLDGAQRATGEASG